MTYQQMDDAICRLEEQQRRCEAFGDMQGARNCASRISELYRRMKAIEAA